MVRFAASLAAESADNVKGVVAARGDPVLRATAWHVKVRVRTIHCVARPASPGLPDLDLRYRSMFIAIWNLHRSGGPRRHCGVCLRQAGGGGGVRNLCIIYLGATAKI